jgi:hypothetical protein
MNTKRFWLAFGATLVFIVIWSWLYNGILLRDAYVDVRNLFRPREQMMALFHWVLIGQALLALAFVLIYTSGFAGGGIAAGVRLGIMLELLAVGARMMIYAAQPFPAKLLVLGTVGGFVEMIGAGIIVGAIYRSRPAQ